ncbi:MAG: cellulase family glycosylhydrolase [Betaproteobacteria bacterium]
MRPVGPAIAYWIVACATLLAACAPMPRERDARLPLHTLARDGRMIIADQDGARVRLKSVNWFGFESPTLVAGGLNHRRLSDIVRLIKQGGFNSVRLPWCNEMLVAGPAAPEFLSANPELAGKTPLQLFDVVVHELSANGLMVILDNHRTRGDWCCDEDHGDGLWYSRVQDEAQWLRDWAFMARRQAGNAWVVGAELRNEIRPDNALALKPSWGDGLPATDWKLAAEKAADAVSRANPDLLVIVGGIGYQTDLSDFAARPPRIQARDKLVYAAHDYVWNRAPGELADDAAFARRSFERFGFLSEAGHAYSAPVYISEWGSCLQADSSDKPCAADRVAFRDAFARYAAATGIDFAWWPLNGDQLPGYNRRNGEVETYGLLRPDWPGYVSAAFVATLTR